jgi:ankyrin repeat protein
MSEKNNDVLVNEETNYYISIEIVNKVTAMVQRIVHAYEYEISTQEMDTLVAVLIEDLSKTCDGLEEEFKKIAAYGLTYEVKSSTHQKNKKTPKTVLNKEALNELLQDYKSNNSLTGRMDYLKHFYTLAPLEEGLEEDFPLKTNQNSSVDAYHFIVSDLKETLIKMNKRLTEEQAEAFFTTAKERQLVKIIGQFDQEISPNLGVNNREKFKILKQKLKEDLITLILQLKEEGVASRPLVASKTLDDIVDEQLASNKYIELIPATQLVLHNTVVPNSDKGLGGVGGSQDLTNNEIDAVNQLVQFFELDQNKERCRQAKKYTDADLVDDAIVAVLNDFQISKNRYLKIISFALLGTIPTNNIEINKGKGEQKIDTISLLKTEKVSGSSAAYENLKENEKAAVDEFVKLFNDKDIVVYAIGFQPGDAIPDIFVPVLKENNTEISKDKNLIGIALLMFNPTNNIGINKGGNLNTTSTTIKNKLNNSWAKERLLKIPQLLHEVMSFGNLDYDIRSVSKFVNQVILNGNSNEKGEIRVYKKSQYELFNKFLALTGHSDILRKNYFKRYVLYFETVEEFQTLTLENEDFKAFIEKAKKLESNPIRVIFSKPLRYNCIEKINSMITMDHFVFEIRTKDINFTKLNNEVIKPGNKFEISFLTTLSEETLTKEKLSEEEVLEKESLEEMQAKVLSVEEVLEKKRLEKKLSKAEKYVNYAISLSNFNSRDEKLCEIKCIYMPLAQDITDIDGLKKYLKQKTISYSKGPNVPRQYYIKSRTFIFNNGFDRFILPWLYYLNPNKALAIQNLIPIKDLSDANTKLKGLIEMGVNINEKSYDGMTALMYLIESMVHSMEMFRLLLDNKADVNAKDYVGNTVLMFAAKHGASIDVFRLLLAYGADVNLINDSGFSALLYYVRRDIPNPEVVKCLLENNTTVNAKDYLGETALMYVNSKIGKTSLTDDERNNLKEIWELIKTYILKKWKEKYLMKK